jgi:large subunit ribosomal protein L9
MAFMEIILKEDVANLGKTGDMVKVKAGYGRNYLVPKGLASRATLKNKSRLEHEKRIIETRRGKLVKTAEDMRAKLETITLTITKKVGEGEKLYGSVTTKEISNALEAQGLNVSRKSFVLDDTIKTLGVHNIIVKLEQGISATLKVWVVSE